MDVSLRQTALAIFQAGLEAADPYLAVSRLLRYGERGLEIGFGAGGRMPSASGRRPKIQVVAVGKAACRMAEAACAIVPADAMAAAPLVVTNYDNVKTLAGMEVFGAGHPVPDENGLLAARQTVARLRALSSDDLGLLLLSGGGSALLPYPADGITLAEKSAATGLLLASGAAIDEVNCVRKHLSSVKGGQLAKMISGRLHALILSDVPGDDPSAIASGPTVPDPTTFAEALAVCRDRGILDLLPEAVSRRLQRGAAGLLAETPKPGDPLFETSAAALIGGNTLSVEALYRACAERGYRTRVYSDKLCGEARQAAEDWALAAGRWAAENQGRRLAMVAGGETTVTVTGGGKGGRNQELALAFAVAAGKLAIPGRWAFLSAGTDGRDGPTDAAGAVVDRRTLERLRESAIIAADLLAAHDSYTALKASGDLLMTGPTGTNVADLHVLLLHP